MFNNLILSTDSYKASHYAQYPPGTEKIFSYVESRGGKYDKTVFFGLQFILKKLETHITEDMVLEANSFFEEHGLPFPLNGWLYIARDLNGKIPLKIRAVKEGTVIPTHNVLITIENTDTKVPWVVSWFETMILRVWYPITVATQSWYIKQDILHYLELSSDDPESEINFKLHDFGSRGVSSEESAAIGGAAHLVNFMGSDTIVGVLAANKFYKHKMSGFSIPASEHSSITSWGKDNEVDAYRNMIEQFGRKGSLFACVSDSYDLYNAVEHIWGEELRQEVIDSGATVIIRPDSGNPVSVVVKTVKILDEKFGHTINLKGFKVLNHVRAIQGDGINREAIRNILETLIENGYSATNIAFGMGGALLQQVNRDTQKFAYKCSWMQINGLGKNVFKDPITDPGKKSKMGRLDLVNFGDNFETVNYPIHPTSSKLIDVFENGKVLKEWTLDEVRLETNA